MPVTVEILGPAPVDPARPAAPRADARRRPARDGRLPSRGARALCGRARAAAVRQERALLLHAVHRPSRRRPRLRVRAAGRARQVPLRGRAARLRQRGAGRLRRHRVDHAAAVVERRRGHVGRQLLRLHAVGRGGGEAPRAQGDRPARDHRRHRHLAGGRDAALRCALPGGVLDRRQHERVAG